MTKKNVTRLVLILIMAFLPSIIIALVIPAQTKAALTDFFPISPNDQNEYWHQIATFRVAGLEGGYYTHLEKTAFIPKSKFGAHGPFYVFFLGSLSKLTGWDYATPIFFNMAFIALGFILFAWFSKLENRQIVLAGLAMSFFPPLLQYIPTAMQESTHQMAAMIFALLFGFAILQQEKMSRRHKLAAVLFTLAASLIRPSWALLFIPLFVLFFPKNLKGQISGLALSLLSILLMGIFTGMLITPGNNTITQAAEQFGISFRSGLVHIYRTVANNFNLFLRFSSPQQLIFRLEYTAILLLSIGITVFYWLKNSQKPDEKRWNNINLRVSLVILLILLPIIIWSFTLYFMKNDFRFIAPYVLLITFLLIFYKKEKYAIIFILVNLMVFPTFSRQFSNPVSNNFIYSEQQINATRRIFQNTIQYQPNQTNSWCNTILVPITRYDYRIALIPPGIGISYVLDNNGIDRISFPVKSKYLLLTPQQKKEIEQKYWDDLKPLAELPDSSLFLNQAANCP